MIKLLRLCLFLLPVSSPVFAADLLFKYEPEKVVTNVVYHYQKSNIDGSHASLVSIYRASPERIESLKYRDTNTRATLVVAELNQQTLNVSYFRTTVLRFGMDDQLIVEVDIAKDGKFEGVMGDGTAISGQMEPTHWHSYDFDFVSLDAIFPFLVDPQRAFSFHVGDPAPDPEMPVDVNYLGVDVYGGIKGRKYSIDGPGLRNRGGVLWTDLKSGHLLGFEIDQPDEDGYESNKLLLLAVEEMTQDRWECTVQNFGRCPN